MATKYIPYNKPLEQDTNYLKVQGTTKDNGHYVEILRDDTVAIDPDGNKIIELLSRNYILVGKVSESSFDLQIKGGLLVIGPFETHQIACSVINKINGYCSSMRNKKGED